MIESNDDLGYLYLKGILSIIYSEDYSLRLDDFKSYLNIDIDLLLCMLNDYLYIYNNCIDNKTKNNIYYLIRYLREYLIDLSNEEQISRLNETVTLTNNSNDSNIKDFLFDQLDIRYGNIFSLFKICKNMNDLEINKLVKRLIINDFYILYNHLYLTSDESFEKLVKHFTNMHIDYILSINCIMDEWPHLYENKLFISRVKKITNIIETNISNQNKLEIKTFKCFKKKINKI